MTEKCWIFKENNEEKVQDMVTKHHISYIVSNLLVNRGIVTDNQISEFLYGDFYKAADPFLLKGMDKACHRILKAISLKERITVFGDYDVDGVTSTAVLVSFLREKGVQVDYYIPSRADEGYGLNICALESIKANHTTLIITVDSGVTAMEEVKWCNENGIDVIITDHHECKSELPDALAIVNPKRPDNTYPYTDFAGVGVVFKLITALSGSIQEAEKYCDLVAIGTIADVMPVMGENRTIIKKGLSIINGKKRVGIKAILDCSGFDAQKNITTSTIGFLIAPKINAAGRIGCARRAVELFLAEDKDTAKKLAAELCAENQKRRDTECEMMEQALEKLSENGFYEKDDRVIVLWDDHWHNGVIGIVASRLCERFSRPTILVTFDSGGDVGKGSARSINSFNMYAAIEKNARYLEQFGGHEMAAGLSISKENVEAFKQDINRYADEVLTRDDLYPVIEIDMELVQEDLTIKTAREIEKLMPFGVKNPTPLFVLKDVIIQRIIPVGNDKHIKMTVVKGGQAVSCILFSVSSSEFPYTEGDRVDIAGMLNINEFNGTRNLQITVCDIKLTQSQLLIKQEYDKILKLYRTSKVFTAKQLHIILPKREHFVAVFQYIKNESAQSCYQGLLSCLDRKIKNHCRIEMNPAILIVCLDVFKELSVIDYDVEKEIIYIKLLHVKGKIDLNTSKIWSDLKERDKE